MGLINGNLHHAVETKLQNYLKKLWNNADVFLGLSAKGAVNKRTCKKNGKKSNHFCMC